MVVELIHGPLDGLKLEASDSILFIKYRENRIAIYYDWQNKYIYFTSAVESELEDIAETLLNDLKSK